MDSGAFTAYNSGNPIMLGDYCNFLDNIKVKPWRYFTLDVYGDPDASMQNYNTMIERGYTPVPVFTTGDPLETLDCYYKTSDMVALGGLTLANSRAAYLKWITENNKSRKTHMLSVTDTKLVRTLKPYTCDSSTWLSSTKFGRRQIYLFNGEIMNIVPEVNIASKFAQYGQLHYALKKMNISLEDLTIKDKLLHISSRSWTGMSIDFRNKIGTRLFMVCGSVNDLKILKKQHQWWQSRV